MRGDIVADFRVGYIVEIIFFIAPLNQSRRFLAHLYREF